MGTQVAEAVLRAAVEQARTRFGERLVAVYAIGSLAHGGFADAVSDIDLGLVLADADAGDAARIDDLGAAVKAGRLPLAERLSVFWGWPASLAGTVVGGRFPAVDRLDLIRYGLLLHGREARAGLPEPTRRALVVEAAAFALRVLGKAEVTAQLADPPTLARAGAQALTKRVLFPVRFLYTAETGEVGRNEAAVAHYQARATGPAVPLVEAVLTWREVPIELDRADRLLRAGLRPLYREFLADHIARMHELGEPALAGDLESWRARLG